MPYWRLSGFYFFYFATLGVLIPYWGLYLKSVGLTPADIGNLMALFMFSRIVAPNVWGWIADHSHQRMRVARLASFLAALIFSAMFFGASFWWLAAVMLLFSFFWNAALPLLEVTTMNHSGARAGSYARVRLWGSVGFIVSVLGLGPVLDRHGPWWVVPSLFALMLGIWLCSLLLPDASKPSAATPHSGRFLKNFFRLEVVAFLLACFLMQASHGPYYTFYSIYLESHGYSKSLIGGLWAFAVLCEVGVFLVAQHLFKLLSLRAMLLVSFACATLRWLMIGHFPDQLGLLIVAQVLHASSFGSFHATAIQLVHRFFTGTHQFRGQALYGSLGVGLGGAVGSLYSGYLWESAGPALTFNIAALISAGAFLVTLFFIRARH
ncbi:MAG: MFS transporter [Pseudomonadota bacterium]